MRGKFITLEGIDGCGKTSLLTYLVEHLQEDHLITLREPGGTVVSEKIRDILLDRSNQGMTMKTEAFLYAAARSQLVDEIIQPAMEVGHTVIADRYMDSTVAYQGYGRRLEHDFIEQLNRLCTGGLKPDLTILLDVSPELAWKRRQGEEADRLEQEGLEFQQRVRQGYIELAARETERIRTIDASRPFNQVAVEALKEIQKLLNGTEEEGQD